MRDLKCVDARLWLQAPDELASLDARQLERHLDECAACAAYRRRQIEFDSRIVQSLNAAVTGHSVRTGVRARLTAPEAPKQTAGSLRPWRRFLPAIALTPIAAVALALVLVVPSLLGGRHGGVPVAGATPWHPKRVTIGYPITVDATNPAHLLAGAWGQVYESSNSGNSWHQLAALPPHLVVRDLAIDFSDPHRYVVATRHEILVSSDAGARWTITASGLQGAFIVFLLQSPTAPGTFFAGPSVLWTSSNHGSSWHRDGAGLIFAPDGIQSLTVASNGDLYTGIWQGGVAVSHDGGVTWQRRSRGLAPNVLDVTTGPAGRLWAATDRGIYLSTDQGANWHPSGPSMMHYTTAVLDTGSFQLAGGDGGVFRSTDGGQHWKVAATGLPLAPYVFGFVADPGNRNTVYASLDGDGIFRSDDGGRTWHAANTGLQISGTDSTPVPVLFRRSGEVWRTDADGTDPGNLTVDNRVRTAVASPDGVAAVYLTPGGGGWAARVVDSGGSAARTIATGSGTLPHRVLWSPDSSSIAVVQRATITTADLSGHLYRWPAPSQERLLGWTRDAHDLLFWNSVTGVVLGRSASTSAPVLVEPGSYASRPLPAPDGTHLALLDGGRLEIGAWGVTPRQIATTAPTCRLSSWSSSATRLLLVCPPGVQEWSVKGKLVAAAPLPANAFWAPGSTTDLLFFRHSSLWRWSPPGAVRQIVAHARSVAG